MRRSFISMIVLVAAMACATSARADDQAELDKGRNAYLGRQYDVADQRFREMLDPQNGTIHDPVLVNQAYMYWGAVMVALDKKDKAGKIFEQLLQRDSHFEPDPLSFPTAVLDVFTDTRNRIRDQLNAQALDAQKRAEEKKRREEEAKRREAARVALLEQLATRETTIEHHSRWIALMPFGAGQFQNGQTGLGWFFLGSESVLAVTAGVAATVSLAKSQQAQDIYHDNPTLTSNQSVTAPANEDRNEAITWRWVNLASAGAFVLTAAIGIAQANVKFQRDIVTVRQRPLPPAAKPSAKIDWHLSVTPLVTEHANGGTLGVSGTF
ncbi:MAG: hypothetical protein ACRELY_30465 [Polyangiaceae bacterium]